jgi:DNA-binding transcriptional ArsR family regulator
MSTPEHSASETENKTTKELRYEHPTGWLYLMKDSSEGLHLLIDALLTASDREFTRGELAEAAGVSRHTVRAHIETLLEHGIVRSVADGKRYRFNFESPVTQEICELNSAVNAVGMGHTEIDAETGEVSSESE